MCETDVITNYTIRPFVCLYSCEKAEGDGVLVLCLFLCGCVWMGMWMGERILDGSRNGVIYVCHSANTSTFACCSCSIAIFSKQGQSFIYGWIWLERAQ